MPSKTDEYGVPKNLGIKIGSKEEAAWTKIKDGAVQELEANQRAIIIGKEIIKLAERKIAIEKKNFK